MRRVGRLAVPLVAALFLSPLRASAAVAGAQDITMAAADERSIRTLVEALFAAYTRGSLEHVLALWSKDAPELAARTTEIKQQLNDETATYAAPALSRLLIDGEQGTLRAAIARTVAPRAGGQPRREQQIFDLTLVKGSEGWRVWRLTDATAELASALVAAPDDRSALIARDPDLRTPALVTALVRQARAETRGGTNARALRIGRLAHEIAVEIGDDAGIAAALNGVGLAHELQGELLVGLDHYERSLAIRERIGDQDGAAETLNNMGVSCDRQGRYAEALAHYERSIALYRRTGNTLVSNPLNNAGLTSYRQANYHRALVLYRESLAIATANGRTAGSANMLMNIGMIHHAQGDSEQALDHYQKSLAIFEANGRTGGVATALVNLGLLHSEQGRHAQAIEHLEKSLKLREGLEDRDGVASVLNTIGLAHEDAADYPKAVAFLEKALAIRESLGRTSGVASTSRNLASVYEKQHEYEKALRAADRATELARQMGALETLWRSRYIAGASYRGLKETAHAREAYEEAIATIEALRGQVAGGEQEQQRFFESRLQPYHGLVGLLVEEGRAIEALLVAERARSRVLLDVLYSGRVNITKAMPPEEQTRERTLTGQLTFANSELLAEQRRGGADRARLEKLNAQRRRARLDLEAFQTNLYAAHPELRAQRGEAPPLSIDDLRRLLDARTVVLEFVVTDSVTFVFAVEPSCGKSTTAPCITVERVTINRMDLARRIEALRRMMAGMDARFADASRDLYVRLLSPVLTRLRGKDRLIVVPDGPLWELPFQALSTGGQRYLLDDAVIAYAPSVTVLRETMALRSRQRAAEGALTLLAMGNPAIGDAAGVKSGAPLMDGPLEALPDAERQVRSLAQIYGTRSSRIYVGADAREDRFKADAGRFRIIHLATHGILNDRNPMYSQLVLAQVPGAAPEDGVLEAWELMQLDLRADLAVLSACETARGRVGRGEGMLGLTWSLFVAGVPTTVVSQWKVRADSTAELMIAFHRRLTQSRSRPPLRVSSRGRGVASALRDAALEIRADPRYRHPFHWAAFIAVGDGH